MAKIPETDNLRATGWHWVKFNLVGVLGFVLQTVIFEKLIAETTLRSSVAFAMAVEMAVLHNFVWHEKWTWKDRPSLNATERWQRLLHFNLTNGIVSLLGAIFFMETLHEWLLVPKNVVYLISIISCSLINFLLSNSLVFRKNWAG